MLIRGRHTRGVTLIELMIGISIIGLLLTLAMPSYQVWLINTQIRTTAESIQQGLLKTRQEAVHRNAAMQFVMTGTSWTIGCVTVTDACPALIESKSAQEGVTSPITVTPPGSTTVVFSPLGVRSTPAPAAGDLVIGVDSAALNATDSRELQITVNAGGGVRMCDPNVSSPSDPRTC